MAADKIIREALALPPEEREHIATVLLDSLPPEEWERAWAAEVERRVEDLDAGRTRAIPGEEVFAKLRARFPTR